MRAANLIIKRMLYTFIRFCVLVGGSSMEDQFESLSENPDV